MPHAQALVREGMEIMASTRFGDNGVAIERLDVSAYTVPTDSPESDGTYSWDKTTIVIVEATAGGKLGLGYTYADLAQQSSFRELLVDVVQGRDAMNVPACWLGMVKSIRNLGRPGIASMAIAAVDAALWDLKARLLDVAAGNTAGRRTRELLPSTAVAALLRIHESTCSGSWATGLLMVFLVSR